MKHTGADTLKLPENKRAVHIHCILEYAALVWDPNTKMLINKFEAIQSVGVCFVTKP